MFWYRIPRPGEAMLISGRGVKTGDAPFKVVTGSGAFVFPMFRRSEFLTLGLQEANVRELCFSKQGIQLDIQAVMAFQVGTLDSQIVSAGRAFVSNQTSMENRVGKIFAGHLRSIVGSLTVEEIIRERQKLADEVLDASKREVNDIGLVVPSFQIESVVDIASDGQRGVYISAMARPHNAEIQRLARQAEAESDRAATEAEQVATRQKAGYQRETSVNQAGIKADVERASAESEATAAVARAQAQQRSEVESAKTMSAIAEANAERDRRQRVSQAVADAEAGTEQAKARQAGPLAEAEASQAVTEAQTVLAEQSVRLRERELEREVIKPAEAAKRQRIAQAEAEAEATQLAAKAAASEGRIALDQKMVEQLPLVVSAAAEALKGANLTVFNGNEGLEEMMAGAVMVGGKLFGLAREAVHAAGNGNGNGQVSDGQAQELMRGTEGAAR